MSTHRGEEGIRRVPLRGVGADSTPQPGKAKMGKQPPVLHGSLPATDVAPWLKTVNKYLKLNGVRVQIYGIVVPYCKGVDLHGG